ncbi:nitrite reductase small subunit NirD [Streptomyces polygonati]|uniref:Nitrite reductase small subunit NirD n=1 Tax=Streptomyces polygonati TaxID=1617087 RepID=A0ABV8HMM0_9ACTN
MTDPLTDPPAGRAVVEIHDGDAWVPVCELDDLLPGRGVAVLLGAAQVALFRDPANRLYALDNRDPFTGAQVLSRGLLGSRGPTGVLISPMLKQAFALDSGRCLDDDTAPDGTSTTLRRWPVRRRPGNLHAGASDAGSSQGDTSHPGTSHGGEGGVHKP